jgi:Ca2+-transporting ATPase
LEDDLRRRPGILQAKASPTTTSVLVFFDTTLDWQGVAAMLRQTVAPPPRAKAKASPLGIGVDENQTAVWHQLTATQVLQRMDSAPEQGLDPETAAQRSRIHGANVIHETPLRGRGEVLKEQFLLLPTALLCAEVVAILLGGAAIEAALLAFTMAANALVGYAIDRRTEQAIAVSKRRPLPPARVLRGGSWGVVPGEAMAVGDIVELAPGSYVNADCRILQAAHLKIDESLLTGESTPVEKTAGAIADNKATHIFERRNMAFMGTLVVGGEGRGVVVAIGNQTVYGKLNALYRETLPPQTPLMAKINALSKSLLKTALVMSGGVLALGLLRGRSLMRAMAPALAIAAVGMPAGLPSAANVNLALGFRRLQRKRVAVRRVYSLESLSAVQVIGFDKTGTLTRSRINVQQIHTAGKTIRLEERAFWRERERLMPLQDRDLQRLLLVCALCTEARIHDEGISGSRRISGSPTEVALLHLALLAGLDLQKLARRYKLQKVRHRGDLDRIMITIHTAPGGRFMVSAKGDPTEVLEKCTWQLRGGRRIKLTEAARSHIESQNQRMAGSALRVLGLAYTTSKPLPDDPAQDKTMTWIGLLGMAEPIREGVASLMTRLHRAGIQTVMITGDQSSTAEGVARQIGISEGSELKIVDSSRFDALTPELASALIRDVQVFARINPAQKLQIIQAYQHQGKVVAMTGDGINDGPALRAADVGIAMGLSGTDAAREVADMVLERDNITSVFTAIVEGRAAYRNLKRALRYFIAIHFSEVLLTAGAAAMAPVAALAALRPVQISPLTHLAPGLALLGEPAKADIGLERPRDRSEPLFSRRDLQDLFIESAALTGGGLTALVYGLARYGPGARTATLAYESLSAAKVLHSLTCRPWSSDGASSDKRPPNPVLKTALVLVLAAQVGVHLLPGLRRLLKIAPLTAVDLAVAGLAAWSTRLLNRKIRDLRQTATPDHPKAP